MSKLKLVYIAFIIFSFTEFLFGQAHSPNPKAVSHYENAKNLFYQGEDNLAMNELYAAIQADSLYTLPYRMLAKIYYDSGDSENMIKVYKTIIRLNPDEYPESFYYLASLELYLKDYDNAQTHFEKLLTYDKIDKKILLSGKKQLENTKFIKNAIKNPVLFQPKNLGTNINSELDEYLPSLTIDEETMVLTVQVPKKYYYGGSNYQEDFFVSHKINGEWQMKENIGPEINTEKNEGAQSLSSDGKYLYFTACNKEDSNGECDIYYSEWTSEGWSRPRNMGYPINTVYWDAQPSISPDGNTLYFSSNRPEGMGSTDLWKSIRNEKGLWGKPINLGPNINTEEVDQFPFIHSDNNTLYFTSNGRTGMGGYDLYYSRKQDDGNWAEASNLGYPINTENDELSLIVNAKGDIAYYASDREGGFGKQDIYSFELYKTARPSGVTYFKGKIFDKDTKIPLKAFFELIDLEKDEVIVTSTSDEKTGEFLLSLPADKNYALNVSKDNYLFFSENFELKNENSIEKPFLKDIPLALIKPGEKVILRNIFFDTNLYELKPESKTELKKLISFLKTNPGLKIEISGHTDNTGNKELNIKLSENRAKAVFDYLIASGISAENLSYAGYADSQPVANNTTNEGKALNRRTEFKIIE